MNALTIAINYSNMHAWWKTANKDKFSYLSGKKLLKKLALNRGHKAIFLREPKKKKTVESIIINSRNYL